MPLTKKQPKRKRLRFPEDWSGWVWERTPICDWPTLDAESFIADRQKPKYVWSIANGKWVRAKLVEVEVGKRGK